MTEVVVRALNEDAWSFFDDVLEEPMAVPGPGRGPGEAVGVSFRTRMRHLRAGVGGPYAPGVRSLTLILAVVACLAAFGLAGCGSSSKSSSGSAAGAAATTSSASTSATTHFAKTKFLLHAGLAFGAFHHFIYRPFRAGDFRHPFLHKFTLVQAGLSALFIKHELTLAATDVRSSKILSALFSPITAVANRISSLKSALTHGSVSSAGVNAVQSQLGSIGGAASAKGQPIRDLTPSVSQLASGG